MTAISAKIDRSYFKARAKSIYWHTRYMLLKHHRLRWLTIHTAELIEAAEGLLDDNCPASRAMLKTSLINARESLAQHGYKKKEKAA